jgi:hypothetical protein
VPPIRLQVRSGGASPGHVTFTLSEIVYGATDPASVARSACGVKMNGRLSLMGTAVAAADPMPLWKIPGIGLGQSC